MLGPGYTNLDSTDLGLKGIGFGLNLALGYSLSDNFVLFAELNLNGAVDPEYRRGQMNQELKEVTAFLQSYGVGAAYYIMPANLFLSAALCTSKIQLTLQGNEDREVMSLFNTDYGFGANVSIGKEWWVGTDLGLGAALQAAYSKITDEVQGGTRDWTGWGVTLAMTATFN
jgi:hypothetical protein